MARSVVRWPASSKRSLKERTAVEIDEVVSTIRVTDGAALDARQMHALVVVLAVEERLRAMGARPMACILDDGRGVSTAPAGMP